MEKNIDKRYNAEYLANSIMEYSRDFDTYEFNDCYQSFDEAVEYAKKDLQNVEQAKSFIEMLGNDIVYMATEKGLDDKDMIDLSNRAYELINLLSVYCKDLEKNIKKVDRFDIE